MPKKVVKIDLPEDRVAMLTRWKAVSEQVAALKSEENQLRIKLVQDNFTGDKLEGVETVDIGWGWKLKATKSLNYSATNESHQTEAMLAAVGAIDPGIATGLVKWKPELSTKVYRQLLELAAKHPELNILIAAATTVKPGMPELEMIAPKEEAAQAAPIVIEDGKTVTDGNFPKGF